MPSPFRKISRVSGMTGGTKWYLSEDCLLAAKRVTYAVEYRRFYLRDLESIVVWPNRLWLLRTIPGLLLFALGIGLRYWVNLTTGAIFGLPGLAWVALELALGPTTKARIRTTGATVDLPVVQRMRRAGKVLAQIEAAVQRVRGSVPAQANPPAETQPSAESSPKTSSEATPAAAPFGDLA